MNKDRFVSNKFRTLNDSYWMVNKLQEATMRGMQGMERMIVTAEFKKHEDDYEMYALKFDATKIWSF